MSRIIKKPEELFLLFAGPIICIMMFVLPVTKAPDELMHAGNAWETFYEGSEGFNKYWFLEVQSDLINNDDPDSPYVIDYDKLRVLYYDKIDFSKDEFSFNLTVKKLAHLPQFIGMKIGQLIYPSYGIMISVGRIANALVYTIGTYFLIKKAKVGAFAIAFVALIPMMIQQAASLSYDVLNFVAITAMAVFTMNLMVDRKFDQVKLGKLLLIGLALFATKNNNLLLFLGLLFIDFDMTGSLSFLDKGVKVFQKYRKVILSLAGIGVLAWAIISSGGFEKFYHYVWVIFNTIFLQEENGHLNTIISVGLFGHFGWLEVEFPVWLIYVNIAVFTVILLLESDLRFPKRETLASVFMLPVQMVAIFVGMYFAWTLTEIDKESVVSQGAQGRYFTPFLMYLAPLFNNENLSFNYKISSESIIKIVTPMVLFNYVVMLIILITYYWV